MLVHVMHILVLVLKHQSRSGGSGDGRGVERPRWGMEVVAAGHGWAASRGVRGSRVVAVEQNKFTSFSIKTVTYSCMHVSLLLL